MTTTIHYSEDQLIKLLKQGNEEAYAVIYDRFWQQLFFVVHKRVGDAEDAKEILQEVFLTLWNKREQLEIASLPAYLAAMARYAVYRHLATKKQREIKQQEFARNNSGKTVTSIDLDNRQLLEILTELTNTLPERYRLLFIHHKLMDRPLEEVAAELGISIRTAEDNVTKLMQILRKYRQNLAFLLL